MLSQRRVEPYRVLLADPPWPYKDGLPGNGRGARAHYDTISIAKIKAYPLPAIADDAVLFMWRVAAMAKEAYEVCEAWGFKPVSEICWVKVTRPVEKVMNAKSDKGTCLKIRPAYGMGRFVRLNHEICIIAKRGRYKIAWPHERSVIFAQRREHSRKPHEMHDLVERITAGDGPRLDLFAGEPREGWTSLGELGRMARHAAG